jgi:uncharacterized protein (TIGR04255 family)
MTTSPFDKDVLYKKYKKSFLQQAVVILHYKKDDLECIDKEKWNEYIQNNFFMKTENFFVDGVVGLSKKDESVDYLFSKDLVAIKIQGKDYISFSDTIIPHVYKMRKFIKDVVGLNSVDEVEIRKWDAWQVKSNEKDDALKTEIQKYFLSKDFFDYNDNIDTPKDLATDEDCIKAFKWSVANKELRVNASILNSKDLLCLILYSDCIIKSSILTEKIEEELEKSNYDLFKLFDWSISDNARKLMEE